MCKLGDNSGFTLIEILIAICILSIGLLGMAALTVGIMRGNSFSNQLTTASILAQDKMEDIRKQGYSGTPSVGTTTTEDYNSITNYPSYKRVTDFAGVGSPQVAGMKMVTVTVHWDSDAHSVELKTILAQ